MKRSKKYLEAQKQFDKQKFYPIFEACEIVKKISFTKFDACVELSIKTNLNPKKAEQNLRGAFMLPNGTGKVKKVVAICDGEDAKAAQEAGADFVGDADLLEKIKKGWFDFDIIVATPKMMPKLGVLGKILGPKGLMPNPKTGTVTTDMKKAVSDIKKGKVEFMVDKLGNIHLPIGLVSFDAEKLKDNATSFVKEVFRLKPSTVKGQYVQSITICSTMGPGVKIDIENIRKEK